MIHVSVTVYDAGTNLCPEFNPGFRLSPDNGAKMRLLDADDAVCTSADIMLKHHFLLFVYFVERSPQTLVIMPAEARGKIAGLLAKKNPEIYGI